MMGARRPLCGTENLSRNPNVRRIRYLPDDPGARGERGEQRATRRDILLVGEERLGAANEAVREQLTNITDPERLIRMLRRAVKADTWQEIVNTP
jgi:hypothetical protein